MELALTKSTVVVSNPLKNSSPGDPPAAPTKKAHDVHNSYSHPAMRAPFAKGSVAPGAWTPGVKIDA